MFSCKPSERVFAKKPIFESGPVKKSVVKTTTETIKIKETSSKSNKSETTIKSKKEEIKKDNSPRPSVIATKEVTINLIENARGYIGTPYKLGGNNKSGIDCSGLIYNSFLAIQIKLPRTSSEQSQAGEKIKDTEIIPGDVLFFNTSGSGISHSGLVEKIVNGEIFFIHSSSSKGVIITSLNEEYWKNRYKFAKRFL